MKPSPTPAYFPLLWSSRMEHSGRITPASQSSLCPPGLQLCHLGCSPGKTEDQLISKGATGPGAGARLTRTWAGRGQRAHSALCRGFKPGVERPSPILRPSMFLPLLQLEEEMETVFDMEPSSTSSTPTSLVSQCLHHGGQVRRGCPHGVGYFSSTVGAPAFSACPGCWGGFGTWPRSNC